MRASKKKSEKKKKRKSASEDDPGGENGKKPRESGKASDDELEALGGSSAKSSWNTHSLQYIMNVRENMVDAVGFDARGNHDMYGEWPEFASGVVVTYADPFGAAKTTDERDQINPTHFSLPISFFGDQS